MASNLSSSDFTQQNFNPTWMKSAFNAGSNPSAQRPVAEEEEPMSKPLLANNRYGREEVLALCNVQDPAPDGLRTCSFYVAKPYQPMVYQTLTDMEERFQHNINSSKAMSSLTQAEKANVASGGVFPAIAPNGQSRNQNNGGWTPVKSSNWTRGSQGSGGTPTRGTSRLPGRGGLTRPPADSTSGEESPGLGQKFALRGKPGMSTTRGAPASQVNTRAQGLYDPKDPTDRPRNRLRSTSDEGDQNGSTSETPTKPVAKNPWTKTDAKEAPWTGVSRSNSNPSTTTTSTTWKSEASALPEWMNDEEEDTTGDDDVISGSVNGPGSFDEDGRFKESVHRGQASSSGPGSLHTNGSKLEQSSEPSNAWLTQRQQSAPIQASPLPVINGVSNETLAYAKSMGIPIESLLTGPTVPQAPVVPQKPLAEPKFYYIDPTKEMRGPFEKVQMDSWFKMGYFMDDLDVRRDSDTTYKKLKDLKSLNGALTPFDYPEETVQPPVSSVFSGNSSFGGSIFGAGNVWNDGSLPSVNMGPQYQALFESQLKHLEEARLRELEFNLLKMRENDIIQQAQRQAEERERMLKEKEDAMKKKEEELRKMEEDRLRMEMERLQMAEKMRLMEEEFKARQEEERKKALEEKKKEELRLIEEQRIKVDAERKRIVAEQKIKEEEERRRKAEEAAEEHRKNLLRKAEEDAARIRHQQAAEAARRAQELKEQEDRERRSAEKAVEQICEVDSVWEPASKPKHSSSSVEYQATKSKPAGNPWSSVSSAPKEKTLREIQEEEERQMRAEKRELERLRREDSASKMQSASGSWASATQRISWNQPKPTISGAKMAWGGTASEQPRASSLSNWDGPTLQAANKPSAPAPQKKKPAETPKPPKNEAAIFLSWVTQRIKNLSTSVDADFLASFLETVEDPNEVEDYVEGNLGTSKAVKEFVKEFILKRSEMRKRNTDKDDLSSASRAPTTGTVGPSGQGKKKKGKTQRLVVDGSCLGFRATSDPNRVNQGEIETVDLGQKR